MKILVSCFLSLLLTIILYYIPNKSNFSKYYMIPLLVILLIKYAYGDWDKGYTYTYYDILFYLILGSISIVTIYLLTKFISNIH